MKCTDEFLNWIDRLDRSIALRIDLRIQRLADGNPGFHNRFDNLLEIKWSKGTIGSFRVYCAEIDGIILLIGGQKDRQSRDIEKAKKLLDEVKNGTIRIKEYK